MMMIMCSVCTFWISLVLLEPSVLPGVLQRRCYGWLRDVWHAGAYCRVFQGCLSVVQGGCRHVRLATLSGRLGRWNGVSVLVRIAAFRRRIRWQRKLHVHVAALQLKPKRRRIRRHPSADTSAHKRSVTIIVFDDCAVQCGLLSITSSMTMCIRVPLKRQLKKLSYTVSSWSSHICSVDKY